MINCERIPVLRTRCPPETHWGHRVTRISPKKAVSIVGFVLLTIAALAIVLSRFVSVSATDTLVPAEPLRIAIDSGAPVSEIQMMLDADPAIATRRFNGADFPIVHAVRRGNPEIVRLLLQHGADPNVSSMVLGASPLFTAALNNDIEIGKILLEYGADPELPNELGITVLELCEDDRHSEFRALLPNRVHRTDEP